MRGAQSAGHYLKEKDNMVPFVKSNAFFLLRMRHLLFLLGTSESFWKFNSFLFIYLFICLFIFKFNLNFFHLFIRSPQVYVVICAP